MNSTELLALSPGALAQLEAGAGTSVRVRRVGSPEEQRALLRAGHPADLRVDTPMSLAEILKRKLPGQAAAPVQIVAVEPVSPPQPTPARGIPALPPLDPRGTVTVAPPPGTGPRTPAGREARRLRGPGGIILDCRQRPSRGKCA